PASEAVVSVASASLTQRDIADAIARGTKMKRRQLGLFLQDSGQAFAAAMGSLGNNLDKSGTNTGFSLRVYTPKAWLLQLGADAGKEYRPFSAADVTEEMLENVMRVVVYPDKPTYVVASGLKNTSSVQHVVLRDEAKKIVIQPTFKEE